MYESIAFAGLTSTAYVEVAGGDHSCDVWTDPNAPTPQGSALEEALLGWLDRFVQGDRSAVACPPVPTGGVISETRAACR